MKNYGRKSVLKFSYRHEVTEPDYSSKMAFVKTFMWVLVYSSLGMVCFIIFVQFGSVKRGYPSAQSLRDLHNERLITSNRKLPTVIRDTGSIHRHDIKLINITKLVNNRTNHLPSNNSVLNTSTEEPATISSLSSMLEPKNWKRDGYTSVRENEFMRHCDQCAIVTSSGHLLGTNAGPEIDATECVIRMNAAPTGKYAADVGHKTTFRIIGHRNFPRMFDTEGERQYYFVNTTTKSDAIVTAWLYAVNVNKNIETFLSKKYSKKYLDTQFYMTTEKQMQQNERLFYQMLGVKKPKKHLWMSTGWTTMIFALEVCDNIHVYGMTYEEYCQEHPNDKTYYHYFDKIRRACDYFRVSENKLNNGHKFLTEKLSFANWASVYNVTFHYPSWENHTGLADWESPFHKAFLKYQSDKEAKAALTGNKT